MNKKTLFILIIIALISTSIFLLLNKTKKIQTDYQKIKIVTTLFPLYDFAKNIGQDKVEVLLLLPTGVEAHAFEPRPSDLIKINEADLFIYTGKIMEPWAADIIKGLTNQNIKIIDSSEKIEINQEDKVAKEVVKENSDYEHIEADPHIWLDFSNDQIIIDVIAMTLIEKDPFNSEYYQKNARAYQEKLISLDEQYKSSLLNCVNNKIIYGGHYAFAYLGRKYGLTYESAYGISPDSEPSAQDLIRLIEQIKTDKIEYIFFEELLSPKVAETLTKETGTKLLSLNPAHNLSKEDFENDVSFLSVMEKNLINLKIGLHCSK